MTSDYIKALQWDVERLETELQVAKERLHKARCDAAGIAIGDIVIGTGRYSGKRFKVCKIEPFSDDDAWISGHPERVSGGWSTAVRNVYGHWTKESAA